MKIYPFLLVYTFLITSKIVCVPYKGFIVVLFGGNGDLARRYLWKGIFNLYRRDFCQQATYLSFAAFSVGRTNTVYGNTFLNSFINSSIDCLDEKEPSLADNTCRICREEFIYKIQYKSVKSVFDLDFLIKRLKRRNPSISYYDFIYYLAVPPHTYFDLINLIVRCSLDSKIKKTMVGIEKPLATSQTEARRILNFIKTHQTRRFMFFLIDHYLLKIGLKEIVELRKSNHDAFGKFFNKKFIKKVEIILKESVDCEGRTLYYNNIGVLFDVFQNHLTEMMLQVTIDIESLSRFTEPQLKNQVLCNIINCHQSHVLLGQYDSYNKHLSNDLSKNINSQHLIPPSSITPTFAALVLTVNNSKWDGVPFVLLSGKKLSEKSVYVAIYFEKQQETDTTSSKTIKSCIKFYLHHPKLKSPAIEVNGFLLNSRLSMGDSWTEQEVNNNYQLFVPCKDVINDAYTDIFYHLHKRSMSQFVSIDYAYKLWEIWSEIAMKTQHIEPFTYDQINLQDIGIKLEKDNGTFYPKLVVNNQYTEFMPGAHFRDHVYDVYGANFTDNEVLVL